MLLLIISNLLIRVESEEIRISHHYLDRNGNIMFQMLTLVFQRTQFVIQAAIDEINSANNSTGVNDTFVSWATPSLTDPIMALRMANECQSANPPHVFFGIYQSLANFMGKEERAFKTISLVLLNSTPPSQQLDFKCH